MVHTVAGKSQSETRRSGAKMSNSTFWRIRKISFMDPVFEWTVRISTNFGAFKEQFATF